MQTLPLLCPLSYSVTDTPDISLLSTPVALPFWRSRGDPTPGRSGHRGVGHRLTKKERSLFEAAKRQGFLKIPVAGIRPNVINVYRLWCQAVRRDFITR